MRSRILHGRAGHTPIITIRAEGAHARHARDSRKEIFSRAECIASAAVIAEVEARKSVVVWSHVARVAAETGCAMQEVRVSAYPRHTIDAHPF